MLKNLSAHNVINPVKSGISILIALTSLMAMTSSAASTLALTQVEKGFMKELSAPIYDNQKILTLAVKNSDDLNKLTVLRFIEWAAANPNGVIALPTGRAAKEFASELAYYKKHWDSYFVSRELRHLNIRAKNFPDTSNLVLVQTQAYYPTQFLAEPVEKKLGFFDSKNNKAEAEDFNSFVEAYYKPILNLKSENILSIHLADNGILKSDGLNSVFPDLSLIPALIQKFNQGETQGLTHKQLQALSEAGAYLADFDSKIKSLGGIGFYLESLSAECTIGFNQVGTSHESGTRLVDVNNKAVVSIGLGTLTQKKDATILITANGKTKARAVKNALTAINNPSIPATAFYSLNQARFYLSDGAEKKLKN